MKNNKNMTRKYVYNQYKVEFSSSYCEFAPLTRDVICSTLQRYRENIGDKKLSVEHTPLLAAVYLLQCGDFFAANISYPYFGHFEKL